MAYVLAVHPMIMADAGMDRAQVITVTALVAGLASILIGCMANVPIAQAPGMGSNGLVAYTLVLSMGVLLAGSPGTSVRERRLLSAAYGYRHSQDPAGRLPGRPQARSNRRYWAFHNVYRPKVSWHSGCSAGSDSSTARQLVGSRCLAGSGWHSLTVALLVMGVPGAILIVILALTFIAFLIPSGAATLAMPPAEWLAAPAAIDQLWLALDPGYLWRHLGAAFPALLSLVFIDLFSSLAAANAVCRAPV
ncbi:MAG: hypothetical protein CM15mP84_04430 [Cellvibrionales bacterium]|nr:MAG: hypothetical protein CM15mP84_04430 [Cellvibrionales bacterium]